MHFYPHNIADFNNSTRHLTRVERSVYRDAIERYYDTEKPLPADDFSRLARVLLCHSDEEKEALKVVLDEFFTVEDGEYRQERCDQEIEKYRANTSAKARAGKASAEARKAKSDARKKHSGTRAEHVLDERSTDEQQTKNQEPRTNNQEPETSKNKTPQAAKPPAPKKSDLDYSSWPAMPDKQVLSDWFDSRKKLKAPVSQTVINNFGAELSRAADAGFTVDQCLSECITRGWKGLKTDWIKNANGVAQHPSRSQNTTRDIPLHDQLMDRSWAAGGGG